MDSDRYNALTERLAILESELFRLRSDLAAARHAQRSTIDDRQVELYSKPAAPTVSVPAPAPPISPGARASGSSQGLESLVAGRGLQWIGLVLVLLGTAFFLDLAFTRGWIGPAERIAIGLAVGAAVLAAGASRMRGAWRILGEGLVALGSAILYLAMWASIVVFPELHVARGAGFAAMIGVTAALAAISAAYRSERVAVLGLIGGLLTPLLLSDGHNNPSVLAIYLFVLAGGMLTLSVRGGFHFAEAVVVAGLCCYAYAFTPGNGWTGAEAFGVAASFFLEVLIVLTIAEARGTKDIDPPTRLGGLATLRLALISVSCLALIIVIESLFATTQLTVGVLLVAQSALVIIASRIPSLPAITRLCFAFCGLSALTLAIPAIVHSTVLTFDAFLVEALILFVLAARAGSRPLALIAGLLYTLTAASALGDSEVQRPGLTDGFPILISYAIAIAALIVARRQPIELSEEYRRAWEILSTLAFGLFVFVGATRLCLDIFGGPTWNVNPSTSGQFALSVLWTGMATVLFALGMRRNSHVLRWEALVLFGVTIIKVFTVDLASLPAEYRIASFVGLGVVLVGISAWYTRAALARSGGSST